MQKQVFKLFSSKCLLNASILEEMSNKSPAYTVQMHFKCTSEQLTEKVHKTSQTQLHLVPS